LAQDNARTKTRLTTRQLHVHNAHYPGILFGIPKNQPTTYSITPTHLTTPL
jgi:hypothetical protein